MIFRQTAIKIIVLLAVIINAQTTSDMDVKRRFCGSVLSDTLSALCKTHNEPHLGYYRRKRAVADECCIMPCSKRHLREYYCAEPKTLEEVIYEKPHYNINHEKDPIREKQNSNSTQVLNHIIANIIDDAITSNTISTLQVRKNLLRRNSRKKLGRNFQNNHNKEFGSWNSFHLTSNDTHALNQKLHHENINYKTAKRRKHNCTCRKRREKDNRKYYENLKVVNRPPPQVGIIEHNSQRPIHIGWFYPSSNRNLINF